MALISRKLYYFLFFIAIVFFTIKFFTAIVVLKDDPSSFLVFRTIPSFENKLVLNSISEDKHKVIMSDENGIIGQSIYYLITKYLWWIVALFGFFILYLNRTKSKAKTP